MFEVLTLLGGTADEVAQLCDRLLPGRVDATVLNQIAATDAPPSSPDTAETGHLGHR